MILQKNGYIKNDFTYRANKKYDNLFAKLCNVFAQLYVSS